MGRTNWAPIIIGGGLLIGGAYVWINWKTVCPSIFGAGNAACTGGGIPGLFGGTIVGSGIAQGYGQIYKNPTTGTTQQIDPQKVVVGAPAAKVNAKATIGKPKLQASARVGAGAGVGAAGHSNYTFNSFNTITLNRMSVR